MLVVLSEINCLELLNNSDVYPDLFCTDFEAFKNQAVGFVDADILIILAGMYKFNKKHVIEFIKQLKERKENENDKGVSNVYVLSDSQIPNIGKYYLFVGNIWDANENSGWKTLRKNINILEYLSGEKKKTRVVLSGYDKGDTDNALKAYEKRKNSEDELIRLIKVPDVKEMLQSR